MSHPLASHLAPLMENKEIDELHSIVAQWVITAPNEFERARYRAFGAELRKVKTRIEARPEPPTQEEIEIALTAVLALAGRRVRAYSA
jgi:hypothetical protein